MKRGKVGDAQDSVAADADLAQHFKVYLSVCLCISVHSAIRE